MAGYKSKIKNVFGDPTKEKYLGIRANNKSLEASGLDASLSYIIFPWDMSGGVIGGISVDEIGNRSAPVIQFKGHKGTIEDLCFSPFYDSVFASVSDDATVKVWEIPKFSTTTTRKDAMATLLGHEKKVLVCSFNPVADWILATGSQDATVRVWNLETQAQGHSTRVNDVVHHVKWNYDGSLLACTTKDKYLRIIDPRVPSIVSETVAHEGVKGSKLEWLGGNITPAHFIFTAGFEKGPGRECALWDMRSIKTPVQRQALTRGSGAVFPYWDGDTGLLLLPGRGDGNIRMFEISEGQVQIISEFRSTDSARGFGVAPKRAMDVLKCEICRCYKIDSPTSIQPIQFCIPRKVQEFHEDLYPPCFAGDPALTAQDWWAKRNAQPIRSSMAPLPDGSSPFCAQIRPAILPKEDAGQTLKTPLEQKSPQLASTNSAAVLKRMLTKAGSQLQALDATVSTQNKEVDALKIQIEKLKNDLSSKSSECSQGENKIKELELEIQQLIIKNTDLENLFQSCQLAMLAAAKLSSNTG